MLVARVVDMDDLAPGRPLPDGFSARRGATSPPRSTSPAQASGQTAVRGCGFVASDDYGRDVFVHCSVLGPSGVSAPGAGAKRCRCGSSRRRKAGRRSGFAVTNGSGFRSARIRRYQLFPPGFGLSSSAAWRRGAQPPSGLATPHPPRGGCHAKRGGGGGRNKRPIACVPGLDRRRRRGSSVGRVVDRCRTSRRVDACHARPRAGGVAASVALRAVFEAVDYPVDLDEPTEPLRDEVEPIGRRLIGCSRRRGARHARAGAPASGSTIWLRGEKRAEGDGDGYIRAP